MKEKFSGWDVLFVQFLKRDWKKIIIWTFGVGLFSAGFVPAFKEIAKDNGLIAMFETLQNPAMISMVGPTPIEIATDYTIGAMYAHEMLLFCGLFTMIISVLHVISHTRKEEDLGITELVRSFQIGRQANSLAVIIEIIFIHILLAAFISVVMISFGIETISVEGSLLFGASVGIAGLVGAVIALIMAQIMPNSSAATSSTLAIIGLFYIVRAGTDVSNIDLSMINPLGWIYLTYPFTENNWFPVIFALTFGLFLLIIAFTLEGTRDMGAGFLPAREGREHAKKSLLSIPGLMMNLNKGPITSWLIGFLILGAAYGSIYGDMQSFVESNELMRQMFTQSGISIEKSFTSTIMIVMIGLVAILPIVIINKLFSVEQRAQLSQIFATKVSRGQLFWTSVGIAIISSIVGILLSILGLGGTAIAVMEDKSAIEMSDFFAAGFNFLPSILFIIGIASLALGWAPKLGKVVYVYLAYAFLLNYFGGIIDLPNWLYKTAIQSWIPQMPMEDFNGFVFITILIISIVLIIIGFLGYNRRDMMEGI